MNSFYFINILNYSWNSKIIYFSNLTPLDYLNAEDRNEIEKILNKK